MSTLAGSGDQSFADGAGAVAAFSGVSGLSVDAFGNVLVADRGNHRVRRVTPSGGTLALPGDCVACPCLCVCVFAFMCPDLLVMDI